MIILENPLILKKYSFGTAHHRAIQLIERHEGLTVSDLLNKLKITKQSLNRVLRDLIKNKAILLKKGEVDSRQRLIFLAFFLHPMHLLLMLL